MFIVIRIEFNEKYLLVKKLDCTKENVSFSWPKITGRKAKWKEEVYKKNNDFKKKNES